MLEPITDDLWVCAAPHVMMGLHLGTRMTVLRLPDRSLVVHSPIRYQPSLAAEVSALGAVGHIVCPNLYHHVYARDWIVAFPDARVYAPIALRRKRPDLRVDTDIGALAATGALVPMPIAGSMLDETVLVHPASRTVISADLTENFETSDHFVTRQYLKASGIHGRIGWSRPLRVLYRDRKAARRSIDALLEHDFERVIVAHGRVIDRDGRAAVRATFEGWLA